MPTGDIHAAEFPHFQMAINLCRYKSTGSHMLPDCMRSLFRGKSKGQNKFWLLAGRQPRSLDDNARTAVITNVTSLPEIKRYRSSAVLTGNCFRDSWLVGTEARLGAAAPGTKLVSHFHRQSTVATGACRRICLGTCRCIVPEETFRCHKRGFPLGELKYRC